MTAALRPDFDIEVTETHHNRKKDAPSGTAITLAEGIVENLAGKQGWVNLAPGIEHAANRIERSGEAPADRIEIRSVRKGAVPGIHTVTYESEDDVLEISRGRRIPLRKTRGLLDGRPAAQCIIHNS